jgi:hypothetical protein
MKFGTAERPMNQKVSTIIVDLKYVLENYTRKGFTVYSVLGDVNYGLPNAWVLLNMTLRNEHIPDIERHIRTIKERNRAAYATLPYKTLPPWHFIEIWCMSVY